MEAVHDLDLEAPMSARVGPLLRRVAAVIGLAMVATLLSGPPAHAAYYSKSTISFGELVRLREITLPPAKVGVLHAFTVVDGAGRRLPLSPLDDDAVYSGSSTYHSAPGRHSWRVCGVVVTQSGFTQCAYVVQDSVGTALPARPGRWLSEGCYWVGCGVGVRPDGLNLAQGIVSYQWLKDHQAVPGWVGSSRRLGVSDLLHVVQVEAVHIVVGYRPVRAKFGGLVGTSAGEAAMGDVTGDNLADFLTFTPGGEGWNQVSWSAARTGTSRRGATWRSPVTGRPVVQGPTVDDPVRTTTLFYVDRDRLVAHPLGGGGEAINWDNIVGTRGWSGIDALVPLRKRLFSADRTGMLLARRASDGALVRYQPVPGVTNKVFGNAKQVGRNWGGMKFIFSAGDVTRDGIADVLAIRGDGTLWQYQGRSDGSLGAAKQVGRGWNNFTHVFVPGDMSGDGHYDLVARRADGTVFTWTNQRGSWSAPRVLITGLPMPLAMA